VAAAGKYWGTIFPGMALFLYVSNFLLSLAVVTVLVVVQVAAECSNCLA